MSEKGKHHTATDLNKLLPKETAELYQIVNIGKRSSTAIYHPKYGSVDFKTLSVAKAQNLMKLKAPFIELKATPKTSSK